MDAGQAAFFLIVLLFYFSPAGIKFSEGFVQLGRKRFVNPFERWDDWEWEKAAREVGGERGIHPRWETTRTKSSGLRWGNLVRNWPGSQKRVLLAAFLFLTVFFSARGSDPVSQAVHAVYRGVIGSGNYYASLNAMAKQAAGMGNPVKSLPVDAKMQGKFLPPLSGPVMAEFGAVSSDGKGSIHNGIDVGSALGSPVVAPFRGVVTFVGDDPQMGRLVKLDLGDGWSAWLGNLGDVSVGQGDKVEAGTKLGTVGLSAPLKKPWLHFELRHNNRPVNPLPYLVAPAR